MFTQIKRDEINEYIHYDKIEDVSSFGNKFIVLSQNKLFFIQLDGKCERAIPCHKYGCLMPMEYNSKILMASSPTLDMLYKLKGKKMKEIHALRHLDIDKRHGEMGSYTRYFFGPEKKVIHIHAAKKYIAATDGSSVFVWDFLIKDALNFTWKLKEPCSFVQIYKNYLIIVHKDINDCAVKIFEISETDLRLVKEFDVPDCQDPLNITMYNDSLVIMTAINLFKWDIFSTDVSVESVETKYAGQFFPKNIFYSHTSCLDKAKNRILTSSDQGCVRIFDNTEMKRFKVFPSFLTFIKYNTSLQTVGCAFGSTLHMIKL